MDGTPHVVSDVMTHTVVALAKEARFKEIVQTLEQWAVSALPVVGGDGRVIGVVSEADLLPKEEFKDGDLARLGRPRDLTDLAKARAVTAGELMTSPAVSVPADVPLARAARIMAHHRVKRLPVVDAEGRLTGIVSRGDLLKVFLREDDELAEEVRRGVVEFLFPEEEGAVEVHVRDGVVTFTGRVGDTALVPVAVRLARAVEGVVGVEVALSDPASERPTRS